MTYKKRILLIIPFAVIIVIAFRFVLLPFLSLYLIPAYPELLPSNKTKTVPYVYEEIASSLWGQQGIYNISSDDYNNIVLLKLENDGSYNEIFIEEHSLDELLIDTKSHEVPFSVRVYKYSVEFLFGELINYKLIYCKSLTGTIVDLCQRDLLNDYRLVKRISKNWYYFYY